ncbi:hypothetical protein CMV_025109 [Castanea mollissima]|uniref:Uncharacterized protein n=1 Tax=Castanea mollissima TaxID=60419 RepID=A0A8J4VBT1_9ROSI|nr:hypothetical protein CMV_025109 [Castanea mollissima]
MEMMLGVRPVVKEIGMCGGVVGLGGGAIVDDGGEIICCQIVHERQDTGEVDALSKGDNNYVDDRLLYALGQLLL